MCCPPAHGPLVLTISDVSRTTSLAARAEKPTLFSITGRLDPGAGTCKDMHLPPHAKLFRQFGSVTLLSTLVIAAVHRVQVHTRRPYPRTGPSARSRNFMAMPPRNQT